MTRQLPPVFCAVDTTDVEKAKALAGLLTDAGVGVKLGKEFFTACGPQGALQVIEGGVPLFLDLKFHDIPNTVAGGIRGSSIVSPALVTIHASGGPAMMKAAAEAAAQMGPDRPKVVAVTVLTSMDDADLAAIGVNATAAEQVVRLAKLAKGCGLDGVVCSPMEIALIREACGEDFILVVPGIRPAGSDKGDQKRVMTPADAKRAGADVLVVGRPITQSDDPAAAAKAIVAEIEGA